MHNHSSQTQAARRKKYGLNVAVSVAAVLVLVVLINWIAYRQFVRFDLTATRNYSLSPQTLKVLQNLEGSYQIVTLFSRSGEHVDQALDLVEEYQRYAPQLTVQHIDPVRDLGHMETFYRNLRDRYQDQLESLDQIIREGQKALDQIGEVVSELQNPLRLLLEQPAWADEDLKQFTQSVAQAFGRFASDIDVVDQQIEQMRNSPLPRYSQGITMLLNLLVEFDQKVFAVVIDRFTSAVDSGSSVAAVADQMLAVTDRLQRARADMTQVISKLEDAGTVDDYDKLVGQLESPDAVVMIGPHQVRIVALNEMLRQAESDPSRPGSSPRLGFQGEEKLTSALIDMGLEHRPMVVFVNAGQYQALGARGIFEQVAQRLRNVNFQVEQWSPIPQRGPMGQTIAPGPPPEGDSGQKVVWVILPADPPNPMNPMAGGGAQQAADLLEQRLEAGHAALVMVSMMPTMSQFGGGNPIVEKLPPWGISPQTDRLILRQVVLPDHQHQTSPQLLIEQWPSDMPITRALAGVQGLFVHASPLVLGSGEGQQVSVWPLVQVSGEDLWTQRNPDLASNPKLDPATAGGPFVIAAASQRDGKRLVVVADPAWASDQITTAGPRGLPAEIFGAAFPANAELFVNSIYWLASLDHLIAASARTQDIRRTGPMSRAYMESLYWFLLLGMPIVVILAGVGVWFRRRSV